MDQLGPEERAGAVALVVLVTLGLLAGTMFLLAAMNWRVQF